MFYNTSKCWQVTSVPLTIIYKMIYKEPSLQLISTYSSLHFLLVIVNKVIICPIYLFLNQTFISWIGNILWVYFTNAAQINFFFCIYFAHPKNRKGFFMWINKKKIGSSFFATDMVYLDLTPISAMWKFWLSGMDSCNWVIFQFSISYPKAKQCYMFSVLLTHLQNNLLKITLLK